MAEIMEQKWSVQSNVQTGHLECLPNPDRKGCPGDQAILELAQRSLTSKRLQADAVWNHVLECSPCYREFLEARQGLQSVC